MTQDTGSRFEALACKHLEKAGLVLLERNYRTRFGELDLVMRDGAELVFVEVRFRRASGYGDAAASVTASKQARLIRAARGFLSAHPEHAAAVCRFDVVAFDGCGAACTCHWQQAAFDAF